MAAAPAPIEAESVDLKEPLPLPEPNGSFKRTASKPTAPPPTHVTKAQAEWMLHTLGCSLDEHTFTEIFDETDSDGDGRLELSEFITAMGMLKRNLLELIDLEKSFTRLRDGRSPTAELAQTPMQAAAAGTGRRSFVQKLGGTSKALIRGSVADSSSSLAQRPVVLDEHCVYASDLVKTLGISEAEAEEMIFIADFKDSAAIDFSEFKQVVVNFSN